MTIQQGQKTLDGRTLIDEHRNNRFTRTNYPKTICLKNIKSWKKLFGGFTNLRGITYVTSPEYLLNLYSDYDFEKIELVVGHSLMDGYRKELENKEGVIANLFDRVKDNSLKILGTKATIHTKLYILSNERMTRIINGSPNLSYTAQGSRQREYVWYYDLHHDHRDGYEFRKQINDDYQDHKDQADLVKFMQDLLDLRNTSENDPIEDFRFWSMTNTDEGDRAFRSILKEVQGMAFKHEEESEESFRIEIPKIVKKADRKYLSSNYGAKIDNGFATFKKSTVLDERTNRGIPIMKIDQSTGEITVGLGGKVRSFPERISPEQINQGLQDIESYISLVDRAICHHPDAVKMTMFESVVYTCAAPFANEWLKQKRDRVSLSNRRGPRHLVIFGEGHNGKTTFGRFQNHLLCGSPIEPINGKTFAKKQWDSLFNHITTVGTPYPVIVDDIKNSCFTATRGSLEGQIKSYFENDWSKNLTYPMLIFNTNHDRLDEWAKTRVRRLDFLVKFRESEREQLVINKILERPNYIFVAFAKLYSEALMKDYDFNNDELFMARKIFQELYRIADRELPSYFPNRPPEKEYDMDALYCVDRERYRIFKESKVRGGLRLEFNAYQSLRNFRSRLPPSVASIVDDKVLIIENPKEYRGFMQKGMKNNRGRGFLGRFGL